LPFARIHAAACLASSKVIRASISTASRSPLISEMELAGQVAWPSLITAGSPGIRL
jgi:hypothetical protein